MDNHAQKREKAVSATSSALSAAAAAATWHCAAGCIDAIHHRRASSCSAAPSVVEFRNGTRESSRG